MDRPPLSSTSHGIRTAAYPGVFDPPTLAHIEIIETALRIFDRLIVIVAVNPSKSNNMFSTEERVALLTESLPDSVRDRVEVQAYEGLISPHVERLGASALVRGMRPVADADYEIALALMNAKLAPSIPTVLLIPRADHVYLSSSFVRDAARFDGLIVEGTVPEPVEKALRERFSHKAAIRAPEMEAARDAAENKS